MPDVAGSQRALDPYPVGLEAPAGNPRFPLFDVLRALAVLAVFAYHLEHISPLGKVADDLASHGNCGVAVFFVISGFLLYRPYVASRFGAPSITAKSFYWRRILRILPAYWFALTVLAIFPGLVLFSDRWWQLYTLTQVYDPHTTFAGISPAWSLCIEVSFYMLLPLYAMVAARLYHVSGGAVREILILVALSLSSIGFHFFIGRTGQDALLAYTLPGTFYLFALGMGLALLSVAGGRIETVVRAHGGACWIAAGAAFVAIAETTDGASIGSVHPIYGAVAVLLVLPAIFPSPGLARRTLAIPGLAWLGAISYGLYLWHHDILAEAHRVISAPIPLAGVALAATIGVAATSYYLLELPFLRLKRRSALSRTTARTRATDVPLCDSANPLALAAPDAEPVPPDPPGKASPT